MTHCTHTQKCNKKQDPMKAINIKKQKSRFQVINIRIKKDTQYMHLNFFKSKKVLPIKKIVLNMLIHLLIIVKQKGNRRTKSYSKKE